MVQLVCYWDLNDFICLSSFDTNIYLKKPRKKFNNSSDLAICNCSTIKSKTNRSSQKEGLHLLFCPLRNLSTHRKYRKSFHYQTDRCKHSLYWDCCTLDPKGSWLNFCVHSLAGNSIHNCPELLYTTSLLISHDLLRDLSTHV